MQERIGFIVLGTLVAALGVIMMANGHDVNIFSGEETTTPVFWIGMLFTGVGGVLAQVGIIAVGVALGIKDTSPAHAQRS